MKMITSPLVEKPKKQTDGFRGLWVLALLACVGVVCGYSAFSSSEETVLEEEVGAFIDWVNGVGVNRFDTIGMEIEFHMALTDNVHAYDTLLYTSSQQLSGGDAFFTIKAETNKKTELVTGVIHAGQEDDLNKLVSFINIARQLTADRPDTTGGKRRASAGTIEKFGKLFDNNVAGVVAQADNVNWNAANKAWSPQLTTQGIPAIHLKMIKDACAQGAAVAQNPPNTAVTAIQKLTWIIQEEMCAGVKRYLEGNVAETKENICFLVKAQNIANYLERDGQTLVQWCAGRYPGLAAKTRQTRAYGLMTYEKTVEDLIGWADGTIKAQINGVPNDFPQMTDASIRIEYRRAASFLPLQSPATGTQKEEIKLNCVKALFQGCIAPNIATVKTTCSVPP